MRKHKFLSFCILFFLSSINACQITNEPCQQDASIENPLRILSVQNDKGEDVSEIRPGEQISLNIYREPPKDSACLKAKINKIRVIIHDPIKDIIYDQKYKITELNNNYTNIRHRFIDYGTYSLIFYTLYTDNTDQESGHWYIKVT